MRYITGIHALNLPCSLLTSGDWHQSALQWVSPQFRDSEDSFFGDYGIEQCSVVPENEGTYAVANHIRALLDLLEDGNFSTAQGMNKDFICNDNYTDEVFDKVALMRDLPHWGEIDTFMGREYYGKWLDYKEKAGLCGCSERRGEIPADKTELINDIKTYGVEPLCIMKVNAYAGRDEIRDLYDLTFIFNNYFDSLSPQTIALIRGAVEHKGIKQLDYVMRNQPDVLIDSGKLAVDFLNMYERLGLLLDDNERSLLEHKSEHGGYYEPVDDEDELEQ